jgi:hypothetical protein
LRKEIPMKLKLIIVLVIVLLASQAGAGETLALKTQKDMENYNTGVRIVRSLRQQGGEINLDIVIQGMKDELTGEGRILTEDNVSETMVASQNELKQKQVCRVIEDPQLYEALCKRADPQTPASSHAQVQKQRSDEDQTLAALFVSTPAAPQRIASRTGVLSQALIQRQPPVQFQTFSDLQAAQAQANDEPVKIERSDLARRFGESWLKTQPRQ